MKTTFHATVHAEASISITWINGEPLPQVEAGAGIVVEIRKRVKGASYLYDADWEEILLLALAPATVVPMSSDNPKSQFAKLPIAAAAYQVASMRVVYCSTVGEGILHLALVDTPKRLFTKARQEYHGSVQFRFNKPIANLTDVPEKALNWTF